MSELQIKHKTMSSREISSLVASRHDSVKRTIERLVIVGTVTFTPVVETNSQNKKITVYHVNERDSYIIVAQLSPTFTAKLVDRWQELEKNTTKKVPQTMPEALKLAYEQSLVIEEQQKSLLVKDDLIIASNEASIKAGEILIREFVKSQDLINIGEKKFYTWLRGQEIIQSNSREPYQYFVDRGYFTYKPTEDKHGGKFRYTLRLTPRGKVWLSARFLNWQDKQDIGME